MKQSGVYGAAGEMSPGLAHLYRGKPAWHGELRHEGGKALVFDAASGRRVVSLPPIELMKGVQHPERLRERHAVLHARGQHSKSEALGLYEQHYTPCVSPKPEDKERARQKARTYAEQNIPDAHVKSDAVLAKHLLRDAMKLDREDQYTEALQVLTMAEDLLSSQQSKNWTLISAIQSKALAVANRAVGHDVVKLAAIESPEHLKPAGVHVKTKEAV